MIKKWIIGIIVLVLVLGGFRISARWHVLHKLYGNPKVNHRVAIVPTELDLSKVQTAQGVTCNVGYAEFIIPSTNSVHLKSFDSDSAAILCETGGHSFLLLNPFDPSSPDRPAVGFKEEFSKLPNEHPLRQKFASAGTSFLDIEISAEQIIPNPFWKAVFQDSKLFAFNTILLSMKGATTGMGMHSVHTYQTPETRGLIRVGEYPDDISKAHVVIENLAGTQAVGMHISNIRGNTNAVTEIFPVILKSFRFTLKNLGSQDDVNQAIKGAGILPREEEEESPAKPSTATE